MRSLVTTSTSLTRRQLLRSAALAGMGAALAACATKAPTPTATAEVERAATAVPQPTEVTEVTAAPKSVKLTLQRFFDVCADEYKDVTDPSQGRGECGIIQVLTNKWNAEQPEAQIETNAVDWGQHNAIAAAALAAGDPPDITVFYEEQVIQYVLRGVLLPLDDGFAKVGIDVNDFGDAQREWVSKDGKILGLPWDIVLNCLWFIDVDLCTQAGLVDAQGEPLIPQGKEEFMAHAQQLKDKTGNYYLSPDTKGGIGTERLIYTLVKQQGADFFTPELDKALVDAPEVHNAVNLVLEMIAKGYMRNDLDWGSAQSAWLQGGAVANLNGTFSVDFFDQQLEQGQATFKRFKVVKIPTIFDGPAAASTGHSWVLPNPIGRGPDPDRVDAATRFLKHLYDNNFQWTRTGHLPARKSVLQMPEFKALPHRTEYADAAPVSFGYPKLPEALAVETIVKEELSAIYLQLKTPDQGLADAQKRVDEFIKMSRQ